MGARWWASALGGGVTVVRDATDAITGDGTETIRRTSPTTVGRRRRGDGHQGDEHAEGDLHLPGVYKLSMGEPGEQLDAGALLQALHAEDRDDLRKGRIRRGRGERKPSSSTQAQQVSRARADAPLLRFCRSPTQSMRRLVQRGEGTKKFPTPPPPHSPESTPRLSAAN